MHDDIRILRDRDQAAQRDIDRLSDSAPGGSRSLLCKTTTVSSYPTAAQAFYAVFNVEADGDESEGSSATLTAGTDAFYAWNCGSAIPPSGTCVIVHSVAGKMVFEFNG